MGSMAKVIYVKACRQESVVYVSVVVDGYGIK